MDMSTFTANNFELEDAQNDENNDSYINELEERQRYVQEFINKSFQHFKKGLDLGYLNDQDMNYYQETYSYHDVNDRPMLGPVDDDSQDAASNGPDYDPDYDEEVNRLLDEVDKEILQENSADEGDGVNSAYDDPRREQYEDCYDEFPDDIHHVGPIPVWCKKMHQTKVKESKSRLENLSCLVSFACPLTGEHIKRIEQDHSTVFCKMDPIRHPPLDKPWTNFWKFNCMIKCREIDKPNHAHTADCESVLLEHANTGVSTLTKNVSPTEYPNFVMHAVELFQDFVIETIKNVPYLEPKEATDTVYEKPMWTEMKLRSNYKNELMIIVRGKGVTSLINKLKRYFDSGPGRTSNVISVYCVNQKWSQKKSNFQPTFVYGIFTLRDKVGPISINYDPKTNMNFNAVEAIQLGKLIEDYAGLTKDTTLLDIGCNFGVLSLMMAPKCDRVIGLNTMHFLNSEISQAEQLKKFNKLHNVTFVGCDPKDLLTKCSSLIKRTSTVAVLNLASPYGKSINVIQALRDLPTIWRVIVYGSFTKEFHRNLCQLICHDDTMGDHFLPVRGCILDKSPSVEDAFEIVILFERKPLVTPAVEIFTSASTLNVKGDSDSRSYGSLDEETVEPILKLERGFGKPEFRPKIYRGSKPFIKYRGPLNKFGKFDSPMLPMDKEQPENSQRKCNERRSPPANGRTFDCSVLKQNPPPVLPAQNEKDRDSQPLILKELKVKKLKRIFDSPHLPITKKAGPLRSQSALAKEKPFDCSMLRKEKPFDCSVLRNEERRSQQFKDERPPIRHPLSIKTEFKLNGPIPPQEKYPSPPPPPPPIEESVAAAPQIKKREYTDCPPLTTVKREPMDFEDKEEGELSPEYDELATESKPVDPSFFVGFSDARCTKTLTQTVNVKSEPADSHEVCTQAVRIKSEPEDTQNSLDPQDIENMATPIHNPRALSSGQYFPPLPISTNFTTGDGFELSVRSNQSYMESKPNPEQPNALIKTEPEEGDCEAANEEIEIISVKKIASQPCKQSNGSMPRIRVRSVDDIIKVKNELEPDDDLRTLIEQRKNIQRRLHRERETRCYKEFHGRSPTPDLPRGYKCQTSPSPPPALRKYTRSPSPPYSRERYKRSPSPRRPTSPSSPLASRKYTRSPSPLLPRERYKRSPSPSRRRSPNSWRRIRRSPSPVAKTWIKRERSPSVRKWGRSQSPSERYRRSPSPIRFKREPYSPLRLKREPLSPVSRRRRERSRRSPSSPSPRKFLSKREMNRSPVTSRHDKRSWRSRSRSKTPPASKRRRVSLSPISLSPSPPRKRRDSKERDSLKKKKKKTKSKSKSPSRVSKKSIQSAKEDGQWDIPAWSTLPPTPNKLGQVDAPNAADATKSTAPGERTESIKRERVSRSRSRTPIPGVEEIVEPKLEVEVKSEVATDSRTD